MELARPGERPSRQTTDAYLIELAKRRKGKVATLDAGLVDLLPQSVRAKCIAFIGALPEG